VKLGSLFQKESSKALSKRFETNLVLAILVLLISISYLVQFAFNPAGAIQGDSHQYGAVQPRDWSLLSFSGDSLRNWPTVLLYLVFASDAAKVFFQFLISFTVSVFILIQINSEFKGKTKILMSILFSAFITTPQVLNWNSVLLSESLLISMTLFVFLTLRSYVLSGGIKGYWNLLIATYLWCILKTTNLLIMGLIVLSIMFIFGFRTVRSAMNKRKIPHFVSAIIVIGLVSLTFLNQPNQEFNRDINYRTYAAIAVLTDVNPRAAVLHAELSRVPEMACLEIGDPKSYEFYAAKLGEECQQSKLWMSENFYKWYAEFLIKRPQEAVQLAMVGFIAGNTPVSLYAPHLSILPKPLQDVFFGERNFALRNLGFQPYGEYETEEYDRSGMEVSVPILIWIGLALCLLLLLASRRSSRVFLKSNAVRLDYVLLSSGIIGVCMNSVAVPTEWFRENIYFFTLIYLSLIYLIGDFREALRDSSQRAASGI
jgi:hypothetical protein